ncbi:MAG: hypothetical protein AAGI38_07240 [Bacteroidota bacterium]
MNSQSRLPQALSWLNGPPVATLSSRQYHIALLLIGHAVFLTYLVMGWTLFKERMIAFDSSFYAFQMISKEGFNIEHNRYISYTSQWLPLLGLQLGVGLETFMRLYSAGFMLFYYVLFCIIAHGFRNPGAGIFMGLLLCLTVRYKYYTGVSEVTPSLAMCGLLMGWISRPENVLRGLHLIGRLFIGFIIIFIAYQSHPFVVFPFLVILGTDISFNNKWKDPEAWGLVTLAILWYLGESWVLPLDGYESGKMSNLNKLPEMLPTLREHWVYQKFMRYLKEECFWAYTGYFVLLGGLLLKRKWLTALLMASAMPVHVVIVVVVYHQGETQNMLESYYAYWGIFTSVMLYYLLIQSKWRIISTGVCVFLLAISMNGILEKRIHFQERLGFYDQVKSEFMGNGDTKLLFPADRVPWDLIWSDWALPFESILYYSLEGPEQAATLYPYRNLDKVGPYLDQPEAFLGPIWELGMYDPRKFRRDYFQLPAQLYRVIPPKKAP